MNNNTHQDRKKALFFRKYVKRYYNLNDTVNIFILDRNVISVIKSTLLGKTIKEKHKIDMLDLLKALDVRGNLFTVIASITEGQSARQETREEFVKSIEDDTGALKSFFRQARTDSDFMLKAKDDLCTIDNGLKEHNFTKYADFLDVIRPKLFQPVGDKLRIILRDEIFLEARAKGIARSHPVVLCCLSALYGSRASHGILKPRKEGDDSYNALNDILLASRMAQYVATAQTDFYISQYCIVKVPPKVTFDILTMDKHLDAFLRATALKSANYVSSNSLDSTIATEATISIDPSMFPAARGDQLYKLFELILNSN